MPKSKVDTTADNWVQKIKESKKTALILVGVLAFAFVMGGIIL